MLGTRKHVDVVALEQVAERLGVVAEGHEDDDVLLLGGVGGKVRRLQESNQQPSAHSATKPLLLTDVRLRGGETAQLQLLAVPARVDHSLLGNAELFADVALHADTSRGRQTQQRAGRGGGLADHLHHAIQPQVVHAEVEGPAADAVRLVDDQQANALRQVGGEEEAAEEGGEQLLWRDEDHFDDAARDQLDRAHESLRLDHARENDGRQECGKLLALVLHERDERGDDESDSVEKE